MNIDAVKRHMEYLKQDKFDREFYVALMLYDVCGMQIDNVDEKIISETHEIIDNYDSIYNEGLRETVREEIYDFDYEENNILENYKNENYDEIEKE